MEPLKICPNCRKPLPSDVPLGLCPECLIKSGFPTGTGPGVTGEAAAARFVPPPVGEIAKLFPQLEILRLIGQGGMGAVYKARQPALDRFVALKVLPPAVASDPGFAERFNREARALARLSHPNIVAVHDFGKAGPLHYLVMEFVDGTNLREVERAGNLTPEQALAIVPQICEALQFAHNEGIVHRDIKPENLLLDKKGRLKITDFGIAKLAGIAPGQQMLTGAKDVVGTPHYMAPEQIEKPQTVDHRADIYSLGVVFYEMLTGELPLGKFQPPSKKVQVDVRLDEVVLRTLEKEPERRYQQAGQVKTDVEQITRTPSAIPGRPVTELPHSVRGPAITFGLLYSGFIGYLIYSARELPERMASHFGLDLKADDWMPRSACLFLFAMVPLFFVGLFSLIRILPLPAWCFNLPNRGYWLSPERRAGTAAFIHRAGLWFSCLITGFMTGVQYLTVQANAVVPPHLAASPFLFLIMGFLLATMVFAIHLLYRFVEPDPQTHSTPENPMNKPLTFGIIIVAVCLVTGIAVWSTMPARPDASQLKQAGWQSWQAQQWPEAIAKFQQAVKLAPQDADAWNGLGWATFNSGKPLEAVPAFQKVIALQPDHPAALNGLGQIALAQGRYDETEKYLLQAAPQAPAAWYGLARLYLLEGKFDQAEKWAQKVVDSGQAGELAKRMLQAALAKQLSDGLRLMIQPQWPARQPAAEPAADAGSNPEAEAGAISAAQAWLTFIDQGNYAESWKQAAPFFQRAVTETTWENSMISFRQPLGSLVSRKLKSAQPMTEMPGAPDGRYVVMQFETSFANKKSTIETVTVGPKQDGAWKASGYYIK